MLSAFFQSVVFNLPSKYKQHWDQFGFFQRKEFYKDHTVFCHWLKSLLVQTNGTLSRTLSSTVANQLLLGNVHRPLDLLSLLAIGFQCTSFLVYGDSSSPSWLIVNGHSCLLFLKLFVSHKLIENETSGQLAASNVLRRNGVKKCSYLCFVLIVASSKLVVYGTDCNLLTKLKAGYGFQGSNSSTLQFLNCVNALMLLTFSPLYCM